MGGSNFMLQWPSDVGKISTPYDAATGRLGIAAPGGAVIRAGAAGSVIQVTTSAVHIASGGYMIVYANLQNIRVEEGDTVTALTVIAESAGPESIELMLLQAIDPTPALPTTPPAPGPVPAPVPAPGNLYVQPTDNGIRIRERPVDGKPLGQISSGEVAEVIEATSAALPKVGVKGQWLNVRTLYGLSGFSAAQFFKVYEGPIPPPVIDITGVNLDMNNPLGRPAAERLKGIAWIRVKFNVSYNPDNNTYGNTDIMATFNRVRPFLKAYTDAGVKVVMVFTHQLYGEGAGYHWPSMTTDRWNDLIPKYADFAKRTAALFAGLGLVHCYQIWNEQDTEPAVARAAVPIPAPDYANMLTQTIRAIRSVDSATPIITGGHVGGPDRGSAYARSTLSFMPSNVRPDGIAAHPYGRGPQGHMFSIFGPLDEEISKYGAVTPGKPIWLTEWGVLDRVGDLSIINDVTSYANGFINLIRTRFPNQVAAAIWYAWADGMDNGYGLVGRDDQPKQPLFTQFVAL
jgi:hypothetical protein